MFGLTSLGTVHTAIGLVALVAGLVALARHGRVSPRSGSGRLYVWATVLTCLTGFPIFQHGGFGPPHVLGILTLVVLGIAALGGRGIFGGGSAYVETVGYSLTVFFHFIPGLTETFTRLPQGAPWFSGPDDPLLQTIVGALFVVFLVGAFLQVRALRSERGGFLPGRAA